MNNKIWIIGAGGIALEYAKVLNSLNVEFVVIGRGEKSANSFKSQISHDVITGGLKAFLETQPPLPNKAIIAVGVEDLAESAIAIMRYGVKSVFMEKPGFCYPQEIDEVYKVAKETQSSIFLAYNRRFYSSVLKAEEIIKNDGGVLSFNFEFTEWPHTIEPSGKSRQVLNNWFYANSTHVVDLAFFLGGKPKDISCYTKGELSWHKPSVFAGAGVTENGALFSYQANWGAPGRWVLEILTKNHRLYFKPMESLQIQINGSVAVNAVEIDNKLDVDFKPGFYLETKTFIEGDYGRLCSIEEQVRTVKDIYKIICK